MDRSRAAPFALQLFLLSSFLMTLLGISSSVAAPYVLSSSVVSASGGSLCGMPAHDLVYSAGEPTVGSSANGSYVLWAGFRPAIRLTVLCPTWTGVELAALEPPTALRIRMLRPIPTSGSLEIACDVPVVSQASASVLDPAGRLVRRLPEIRSGVGDQRITWDGKNDGGQRAPSGVYFVRLQAGSRVVVGKALMLR
jgi:hypothetical protein